VVFACFLVGRWARPVLQPWAAAAVLLLLSLNVFDPGGDVSVGDVVFPTLITAAPWLLGLVVQLTANRAERATSYAAELTDSRLHDLQRATDEERLRIARELHDLVAHHLSGVSLQAQVARRHAQAGAVVSVGELTAIEEAARAALTDLRRVLGVLRPAAGEPATTPSEGLTDLDDLLTRCRRAGQNVQIEVVGTPRELAPALSLVAYRVLQEALTNARRHGARGTTSVRLEWLESRLNVRVSNPCTEGRSRGHGHGLLGITERVRLFGGIAAAGPSHGTWNVEVTFPIPAQVPELTS
jgi:signal transduction histidine kinase